MSYTNNIPSQYLSVRHIIKNLRFCKGQKPYKETVHTMQIIGLIAFIALASFCFTAPYIKEGDNSLFFLLVGIIFFSATALFFCGFIFHDLKKEISLYLNVSDRVGDFCAMHEKFKLHSDVKIMNTSAVPKKRL